MKLSKKITHAEFLDLQKRYREHCENANYSEVIDQIDIFKTRLPIRMNVRGQEFNMTFPIEIRLNSDGADATFRLSLNETKLYLISLVTLVIFIGGLLFILPGFVALIPSITIAGSIYLLLRMSVVLGAKRFLLKPIPPINVGSKIHAYDSNKNTFACSVKKINGDIIQVEYEGGLKWIPTKDVVFPK